MNLLARIYRAISGTPPPPAPQRRHYDAGGGGGRWPAASTMTAPASASHAAGQTVGARAAHTVTNSPHGAAIVNALVSNIVADGPSFRPNGPAAFADAFLNRFWPSIDVEGFDFGAFLTRTVRSFAIYGEAFAILTTDPDDGGARVQLINIEQVDRSATRELPGGGRVIEGVELDRFDRIVAYHILPDAPDLAFAQARPAVRIPAADVVHLYDPQWPGQRRGVSMLAPILTRLVEIDRLEDAQLATANTQALVGLIFRTSGGDFGQLADASSLQFPSMEPGASIVAPPGYEVDSFQPSKMDGADAFLKAMQRSAAAGAGIPYALMTGDLSDTNYSSARLGLLEFRRRVVAIQKTLIVPRVLDPIWTRWAALEQMAGRLPRGDASGTWVFPGWGSLDPLKEAQADAAAIAAGTRSRFEIIAARGRDPQDVNAEIAADTFTPSTGGADE
ncbi:MAG: phage portal protein [Pseudomonadota bacterium]